MNEKSANELVCECPRTVKVAAWIYIVLTGVGVLILLLALPMASGVIGGTSPVEFFGYRCRISNWLLLGATVPLAGLVMYIGLLVLNGRAWAYYVLLVLVATSIIGSVVSFGQPHIRITRSMGSNGGISIIDVIVLLLLVAGFKDYREFCRSRYSKREAVASPGPQGPG